jgi:hypothetical protein
MAMNDQPDIHGLDASEDELQAAVAANDPVGLSRRLHDDLLATGPDGALVTKQQDVAGYESGAFRVISYEQLRRRVLLRAATGVTAVRAQIRGRMQDEPFDVIMDYTRTWIYEDGRWQVFAAHLSQVSDQQ